MDVRQCRCYYWTQGDFYSATPPPTLIPSSVLSVRVFSYLVHQMNGADRTSERGVRVDGPHETVSLKHRGLDKTELNGLVKQTRMWEREVFGL